MLGWAKQIFESISKKARNQALKFPGFKTKLETEFPGIGESFKAERAYQRWYQTEMQFWNARYLMKNQIQSEPWVDRKTTAIIPLQTLIPGKAPVGHLVVQEGGLLIPKVLLPKEDQGGKPEEMHFKCHWHKNYLGQRWACNVYFFPPISMVMFNRHAAKECLLALAERFHQEGSKLDMNLMWEVGFFFCGTKRTQAPAQRPLFLPRADEDESSHEDESWRWGDMSKQLFADGMEESDGE